MSTKYPAISLNSKFTGKIDYFQTPVYKRHCKGGRFRVLYAGALRFVMTRITFYDYQKHQQSTKNHWPIHCVFQ